MSDIKLVAVSGSVGIQVFPTSSVAKIAGGEKGSAQPVVLKGIFLTPSGANATVTIRSGRSGASGEIKFFGRAPSAFGTKEFEFEDSGVKFTRGMHVTVIGANAQAYLLLD